MNEWSDDDIAEAQMLAKLAMGCTTIAEVGQVFDKYFDEVKFNALTALNNSLNKSGEENYQKMLLSHGGDFELLSRKLYEISLNLLKELEEVKKQKVNNKSIKPNPKKAGRPAERWGSDSAGKLFFYFLVEFKRQEIGPRTKIIDAIAALENIPAEKRAWATNKRKIKDLAARYSEVKKILKPSKK
jgi:hypothetical protein